MTHLLRWAFAVLLLASASYLPADEYLITEHWVELERSPLDQAGGDDTSQSMREAALDRLMAEIRYVLSGMIYGFTFEYRPSDAARGVSEQFSAEPVHQIPAGDPALDVLQSWVDGSRLYVRVGYELHPQQQSWYASWRSHAIPRVTGSGAAAWFGGFAMRVAAVEDALRSGCREHLRSRTFARPAYASGSVVLVDSPRIDVYAGQYTAQVVFALRVDELRHYEVY